MTETNETLDQKVMEAAVDMKLPCAKALKLAQSLGVPPRKIGDAANRLKIRITSCQLGCFK